jgi:hypothetical protein
MRVDSKLLWVKKKEKKIDKRERWLAVHELEEMRRAYITALCSLIGFV